MLGVYETACDMLLDMSEACRAVAAERPGGADAEDAAEAVALEHWRRARSLSHSHACAFGVQRCVHRTCIAWHASIVAEMCCRTIKQLIVRNVACELLFSHFALPGSCSVCTVTPLPQQQLLSPLCMRSTLRAVRGQASQASRTCRTSGRSCTRRPRPPRSKRGCARSATMPWCAVLAPSGLGFRGCSCPLCCEPLMSPEVYLNQAGHSDWVRAY